MIYLIIAGIISLILNLFGIKRLFNQRKAIKALNEQNARLGALYGEAINNIEEIRDIYESNANATRDELVERLRSAGAIRGGGSRLSYSAEKADRLRNGRSGNTTGSGPLSSTSGGGL